MSFPGRCLLLGVGATATVLAVAVALWPGPVDAALDVATAPGEATPRAPARASVAPAPASPPPRAVLPARARPRVVDTLGHPIVGFAVRSAHTGDVAPTDGEGRVPFEGEALVAAPGWARIESAVLDLCRSAAADALVVARTGAVFGLVVDPEGMAVRDAQVTLELDVELPPREIAESDRLRAVRLGDWTAASDDAGRFFLADAPIGGRTRLRVQFRDYLPCVLEAPTAGERLLLRLARSETPVVDAPPPTPGARVAGQLVDADGAPRAGWWVMLTRPSATASLDAARVVGWPVRTAADGRFVFEGVAAASYCVEAFAPDNAGIVRSVVMSAPATDLRIDTTSIPLPERIEGVVRSVGGQPQAGVCVGLARPTAWAFRGHLGMHDEACTTTDARGRFAIRTGGLSAVDLLLEGPSCGVQRRALAFDGSGQPLEIVVDDGARIAFDAIPAALEGATLLALDDGGETQLVTAADTRSFGFLPPPLSTGSYDVPPSARTVVLRRADRDLGRLLLR